MIADGGHRDAFHPEKPDPACPDCISAAEKLPVRSAQLEISRPRLAVVHHLSLVLFEPVDDASHAALCALIDEQCDDDQQPLWFGKSLAVEPRYAEAVAAQVVADGFEVQTP